MGKYKGRLVVLVKPSVAKRALQATESLDQLGLKKGGNGAALDELMMNLADADGQRSLSDAWYSCPRCDGDGVIDGLDDDDPRELLRALVRALEYQDLPMHDQVVARAVNRAREYVQQGQTTTKEE